MLDSLLKPGRLRTALMFAGLAMAAGCIAWLALNVPSAVDALKGFDTRLLPVLLALVAADYALRFARWRWLLRRATGLHVPLLLDMHLFLAGTAMILTPVAPANGSNASTPSACWASRWPRPPQSRCSSAW